jgi:ferritin-like protein
MANEGYHEPVGELSDETRDMHRAIVSLMEELEAVDWYNQRVDACKDKELAAILAHNRDEEKEHAAMVLEWIRRRDPRFDKELKDYLFTGELLGCIGLKKLDDTHGEIKSMRTSSTHLRRGVAAALLQHVIDEAMRRSYDRLSLETGSGPGFEAAHALFSKFGFIACGPFADYREDPFSRFMTLELG